MLVMVVEVKQKTIKLSDTILMALAAFMLSLEKCKNVFNVHKLKGSRRNTLIGYFLLLVGGCDTFFW